MLRAIMTDSGKLVINHSGKGLTDRDRKDIYAGNGQRQDLHIESGPSHIFQSLINVVHGWGNGDYPVSALYQDGPVPLIPFYGHASA
jgi:hypothetical protein